MHMKRALTVAASRRLLMIHRIFLLTAVVGSIGLMTCVPAFADDDDDLRAVPFAFVGAAGDCGTGYPAGSNIVTAAWLRRSEEHTSELQSHSDLVCRLLLEKKKKKKHQLTKQT